MVKIVLNQTLQNRINEVDPLKIVKVIRLFYYPFQMAHSIYINRFCNSALFNLVRNFTNIQYTSPCIQASMSENLLSILNLGCVFQY